MNSNEIIRREIGDSRAPSRRGEIRTPVGNATPVFCLNCGRPGGFAFVDTSVIVYICSDCEHVCGELDLPVLSEDAARGRG